MKPPITKGYSGFVGLVVGDQASYYKSPQWFVGLVVGDQASYYKGL